MTMERLRTGNFNSMSQEVQPDGSIIITLTKRGDANQYIAHVRNLYQENEEVLSESSKPKD